MEDNKLFSSREFSLLSRGYSREDIFRIKNFSKEEVANIFKLIVSRITKGCEKCSTPKCIFIGGQPGCGKTTYSMLYNSKHDNKYVEICIDNYRMYHPHYLEIEDIIRKHWVGRIETENDTPGNDIADFTHSFAGMMSDLLTDELSKTDNGIGYNILLEWGMRTPEGPLQSMKQFKDKGYNVEVIFLGVNKEISLSACKLRADIMKNGKHIIRKVPNDFHELCIKTLPDSCNTIYTEGYIANNYIDNMKIVLRNGTELWNCNYNCFPGQVLSESINSDKYIDINDEDISYDIFNNESIGLIK